MSVSESDRHLLYEALSDNLSQRVAEVMMELLFAQPTGELVTQADLHANTTLLRGEMSELRGEMSELRGEIAEVRGEVAELRGDLKAEIGNLYRWGAGIMVANGIAVITALVS